MLIKEEDLCFWQFLADRAVVEVWEVSLKWFRTDTWMDSVTISIISYVIAGNSVS